MVKNTALGAAGLLLLATSILLLLFIILPGVTSSSPFSKTYFLRADTNGITGAHSISQWTYFYVCGDGNTDCGKAHAGIPFGYAWAGGASNVPDGLAGSHGGNTTSTKFFYLWRFGWVFIIMSLFFEVLAFFTGFLACCGRLGAAIAYFVSSIALFTFSIAAALTTVTFVEARDKFRAANRDASIGRYGLGFLWGGYAALLIAVVLFAMGMKGDHHHRHSSRRRSTRTHSRRVKEDYS